MPSNLLQLAIHRSSARHPSLANRARVNRAAHAITLLTGGILLPLFGSMCVSFLVLSFRRRRLRQQSVFLGYHAKPVKLSFPHLDIITVLIHACTVELPIRETHMHTIALMMTDTLRSGRTRGACRTAEPLSMIVSTSDPRGRDDHHQHETPTAPQSSLCRIRRRRALAGQGATGISVA